MKFAVAHHFKVTGLAYQKKSTIHEIIYIHKVKVTILPLAMNLSYSDADRKQVLLSSFYDTLN